MCFISGHKDVGLLVVRLGQEYCVWCRQLDLSCTCTCPSLTPPSTIPMRESRVSGAQTLCRTYSVCGLCALI